jgi:hypothetical protein
MSSRINAIRQRITTDHAASMSIFNALNAEQWASPVPSEADAPWTARDVLAHIAISEGGQLNVVNGILAGHDPVPADFDLARYNRGSVKKRADKPPAELLAEIEAGHAQVLAKLAEVAEADLDKTGRHARGDRLTVEGFFIRITEHRRQHAEELRHVFGL